MPVSGSWKMLSVVWVRQGSERRKWWSAGHTILNVAVLDLLQDLGPHRGMDLLVLFHMLGLQLDDLSKPAAGKAGSRVQPRSVLSLLRRGACWGRPQLRHDGRRRRVRRWLRRRSCFECRPRYVKKDGISTTPMSSRLRLEAPVRSPGLTAASSGACSQPLTSAIYPHTSKTQRYLYQFIPQSPNSVSILMRLSPVRQSTQEYKLDKYTVPKGWRLNLPPSQDHHRHSLDVMLRIAGALV